MDLYKAQHCSCLISMISLSQRKHRHHFL